MNFVNYRYPQMLLALLLSGCSSQDFDMSEAFADDQAAAVHFLKPFFPIMDCGSMGIVSKGEVDDHFYDLFYALDKSRSSSIQQDDLKHMLYDSSPAQISYIFEMMDQDESKAVSTAEFRSFMFKAIDLADTQNNGEITIADLGIEPPTIIRAKDR